MALLCFRRLSRAKYFVCCVLPHPTQQSMPLTLNSKAPRSEALHLLCFQVFLKSSSNGYLFRLCFRRLSLAKYSIGSILKLRRKDKRGTIVISKYQPSIILHLPCFRRFGLVKLCIYCFSKALRSNVSSLVMFPTA